MTRNLVILTICQHEFSKRSNFLTHVRNIHKGILPPIINEFDQSVLEMNEENYQLYIRNMEEARISDAMDSQKIANISVIEPAQPPIKPIKPNKLLNVFLSIFLGGFAALGLAFFSEYLNHGLNNSGDVKRHLGVQVMATIPEIKST